MLRNGNGTDSGLIIGVMMELLIPMGMNSNSADNKIGAVFGSSKIFQAPKKILTGRRCSKTT